MSRVWVNGRFLSDKPNKKAEKWKPDPKQEKNFWGVCPECGKDIFEGDSVGMQGEHVRVICYRCWFDGDFPEMHLDCCGLVFPDATLSQ